MMYNDSFEQLFKTKGFSTPVSEFQKSFLEILRRSTQQQLELASENIAKFSEQVKRLSRIKKPEDLVDLQKDIFNEDVSSGIETSQRLMHIFMENLEECSHLCSAANEAAMAQAKATGRKVEKTLEREKVHE